MLISGRRRDKGSTRPHSDRVSFPSLQRQIDQYSAAGNSKYKDNQPSHSFLCLRAGVSMGMRTGSHAGARVSYLNLSRVSGGIGSSSQRQERK